MIYHVPVAFFLVLDSILQLRDYFVPSDTWHTIVLVHWIRCYLCKAFIPLVLLNKPSVCLSKYSAFMAVEQLAEVMHKILLLPNCKDHLFSANKTERAYSRGLHSILFFCTLEKFSKPNLHQLLQKIGLIPKRRGQGTCSKRSSTPGSQHSQHNGDITRPCFEKQL